MSNKTAQVTADQMTAGAVTSADGTSIGYLRLGQGPAVVLLHGSNESARSHTQLALALADAFTVYLPDRRGRGLSGPHRPDHGMRTEVEDLRAVVAVSGAQKVFGVSVSALIALQAARTVPAIRQVAAYEPARGGPLVPAAQAVRASPDGTFAGIPVGLTCLSCMETVRAACWAACEGRCQAR